MESSEWDKHLRDKLDQFTSEGDVPLWEDFARELNANESSSPDSLTPAEDQLRQTLKDFSPDAPVTGWERIEASLHAADQTFDHNIRHKIHQYHSPHDPHSWSAFLQKWSATKRLRFKLISLKVMEGAAVLLLLMTVVQMGRFGPPPSTPSPTQTPLNTPSNIQSTNIDMAYVQPGPASTDEIYAATPPIVSDATLTPPYAVALRQKQTRETKKKSSPGPSSDIKASNLYTGQEQSTFIILPQDHLASDVTAESNQIIEHPASDPITITLPLATVASLHTSSTEAAEITYDHAYITAMLEHTPTALSYASSPTIPDPQYVKPVRRTYLELAMLAQGDYNKLRMPEDRLYSAGKQIVFPQQGIISHGYGAGFTIAIGHPLWALETGVIYNAKDFKPGRQLIIGGAFNNGSVDFEAMRLQMVSVPVHYRYRFLHKSRTKAYALAGFGMHVIAQSDIDVQIRYHFPSLAAGQNPNSDPLLANTIRETRRISEHIRDGAPFSTKSFVSTHAGLGLEYGLTHNKTLFLQGILQYQIPELKFSNNNGKHIRTMSLQMGVRTPLGV